MFKKLYSRDSNGGIRVWWPEVDGAKFRQHYGVLDGKIVTTAWTTAEGKNLGKKNETSAEDQAHKEVLALIKKQLKSNYFENINDIDKGFLEPQLAKPGRDYYAKLDWSKGQIVDHKLNGIACIITRKGAFSRKNEQFFAIPHILKDLEPIFAQFPDAYLQGELFNHTYVNQLDQIARLVSVVRKEKDMTPEILAESKRMVQYHLYDGYGFLGVTVDDNGLDRRTHLMTLLKSFKLEFCKPITWTRLYSFADMEKWAKAYIATGGEGVIIRNPEAPYQHKRTKDLLKYKKCESEEFKTIELVEGTADWEGCVAAVWCELPNGKRDKKFKSNVKGEREHLRRMWQNRHKYVGKMVTVEFQEYSPYGVPLIPYTDMLERNYE